MTHALADTRREPSAAARAAAGEEPSPLYKAIVSAGIVVVVGLQCWAILAPFEDWPFGANVMFGYDVSAESTLYDLEFHVTLADGARRRLAPMADLGMPEILLKRKFFVQYYGSACDDFAQCRIRDDNEEQFHERLALFRRNVAAVMRRRGAPVTRVDIELVQLDANYRPVERRSIESNLAAR